MKEYTVTFTQYYTYTVSAEDEQSAVDEAESLFDADMRYPVANTYYDEIKVVCCEQEEDE